MPGLWGVVAAASSPEDVALFRAMGERLHHHEFYREETWDQDSPGVQLGRVSLGVIDPAPQPATNENGTLIGLLSGEIYEEESLRRDLERRGHRLQGRSQAEILLHGFESEGRSFFRRLNGTFSAAIWDVRRGELVLATDRFGMKPVYYAHSAGRLLFAPEIQALFADDRLSRTTSLRGLAQFFTYGQLLNEDTLFESVAIMPGAGWLTYSPHEDRLTLDRYWSVGVEPSTRTERPAEVFETLTTTFQDAVNRRTAGPGSLGLSLSGGLDSRTILAAIDTARSPVKTVALGMPGSIDVLAAARMSALKGCPFRHVLLDRNFLEQFPEYLKRMVGLTDGHYLSQCLVMPTLKLYRELGIDVLLRGHAGELLHMDKAYNYSLDDDAMRLSDESELIGWLDVRLRAFLLEDLGRPLFAKDLQPDLPRLAEHSLRESVERSRSIQPPLHRIWHHFLTQRIRRETSLSMVEFGSIVETRLPYLDNDFIAAVFATPPALKRDEAVQAAMLRQFDARFLAVPNANTGTRVGACRLRRSASRLSMRVLAKLGVPGYQPYERMGLWLRRELRPLVQDLLLSDACLDRGLFDPTTLRSIVEEHFDGSRNHTFLMLALMCFEQGQRLLLGEAVPASVATP